MKIGWVSLSVLLLASATLALPPGADRAEQEIDEAILAGAIRFLSDDILEGRAPASAGDRLTRLYLRSQFELLGLQPGAEAGQWEQPFEIVGMTSEVPGSWSFRRGDRRLELAWWEDFIAWSGRQADSTSLADAEVVFVGYGIVAPEYDWDDFKGVDLSGKILLMLNNDPDWDPDLFAGSRRLYYGRWDYKYDAAARQGAAGAIVIHTRPSAGYPWQVVQSSWTGEQFELPDEGQARLDIAAWVSHESARGLVELAGKKLDQLEQAARSRDFKPVPLGITASLEVACDVRRVKTANVMGLLPGRDPRLARELVVYTAHHDHIGVGEPDDEGDKIYNGALDNASGMAQLLAIARAYSALPEPPRRSILFLAVAGEEQGLLGSEYYATHPTVPPGRIAANLNIDGGNIWGRTRDLALIGFGKSSLDAVARAAATRQDRTLHDESFPDRGFFYRSDQFNFARIGVPALYFDTGTEFVGRPEGWGEQQIEEWESRHYHQPSDEFVDSWDLSGMVEDARLTFIAGLEIAEADEMPSWTPGDEFEATRRRAIAELPD